MVIVTTEFVTGKNLETIGIVKGSTVQTKNVIRDFTQSVKSLVGGELGSYTDMMNKARDIATSRMTDEARKFNADAVINVRYATSAVAQNAAEIIAYGTAVKFI